MLTPLLSYPTHACVAAILLLAWHEFGINCESSLWMYTGMAVRMAMDLGLHQVGLLLLSTALDVGLTRLRQDLSKHRPDVSPKQVAQERLLWWSVFIMDRILLFGTGRTQTVKDDEITTLLPTDEDMTLVQGSGAENPSGASAPFAFPIYVRLMQLNGIMGEHVNKTGAPFSPQQSGASSRADPASNAGAVAEAGRHDFQRRLANMGAINSAALNESILCQVEDELTRLYNDLPESLQFAPANFRAQEACHMAPIFVQLHLWVRRTLSCRPTTCTDAVSQYNCLIILLYRPPLLHPKTNAANLSLQDRLAVVSNSCLAIGQIVEYADDIGLGSANAYVASPFVNQCLYVAATAWIQGTRRRRRRLEVTPLTRCRRLPHSHRTQRHLGGRWAGAQFVDQHSRLGRAAPVPALQEGARAPDRVLYRRLVDLGARRALRAHEQEARQHQEGDRAPRDVCVVARDERLSPSAPPHRRRLAQRQPQRRLAQRLVCVPAAGQLFRAPVGSLSGRHGSRIYIRRRVLASSKP